ncbi:molybdopterin cofactor-binding domain-containing protein [Microbaculum marinum]|uniref:Molybdopterin cofactor-binding domain-containing protein n=1 Tax=Microbaculum marinum TaxID=1764581 RepID=A0AAW9RLE9_9HYPH
MTIGDAFRHPEWVERTSGSLPYTRDLMPDDVLTGRILRSPHPAAEIVSIDTSAAERAAGVAAVITARDLPDRNYRDYGQADRPPIARGSVVYFGQDVAAVAAETPEQADRALALIRVRYKPHRAAPSLAAALRPGAPIVHPRSRADNIAESAVRSFGNPEGAKERTSDAVSARYDCGIQAHACMESHVALADWDEAGGIMNIWVPTQSPRNVRAEIAYMLDLDPEQVRLHRVGVGGDFGARVKISDIEVLAATLARSAGRPVAISLSRADEFAFTKRQHECSIAMETGVDRDGLLTYRRAEVVVENGAFIHGGSNMMNYASILIGSQYRLEGAELDGRSVYSNRRPGGAFRGAGGPQATFAIECQIDELADEIGIDPIDLRLRNVNRTGDCTITGWEIKSSHAAECLETVREKLNWDVARGQGGNGRGVGVALAMHVSGAIVSPPTGRAEARIEIGHNGGVVLSSGCADPGTGEYAVIAQLCAAELGLRADEIDCRVMDTAETPFDPGAGSSRGTMITGGAVQAAARKTAAALREIAAQTLGCAPDDVVLRDGFAEAAGRRIGIGELAAAHPDSVGGTLTMFCEEVVDSPVVPMTAADSGFGDLSPAYSFAAHGVEVEVDRGTGAVRVLRVVAAHDAGTVVNPVGARSQVIGGVVMGLGAALGEELIYEAGRPVTTSYADYALPRASEAPPVDVVFVGGPSPKGPAGAKSISEIALMPTAAAVANAIAHATGARIRSLPISPDKIVAALGEADAGIEPQPIWQRPSHWWAAGVRSAYPLGLHAALHAWGRQSPVPRHSAVETIVRPRSSDDAIAALAADRSARPAGGATDILSMRDQGFGAPPTLVSLTACADMNEIAEDADGNLTIGAAVTLADAQRQLVRSDRPGDMALAATIAAIASPQIRESGTVGGNLCQAKRCWFFRSGFNCYKRGGATRPCYAVTGDHRYFHAVLGAGRCQAITPSDLATTLIALDATARIRDAGGGDRSVGLDAFYEGPGETVLSGGEIVHSVVIPAQARSRPAHFEKLARTSDGFAMVSACVSVLSDAPGAPQCRAVLGGVANRPYRARLSEQAFHRNGAADNHASARAWVNEAHPLPGNAWKLKAACALLERAMNAACGRETETPT